MAWVEIQTGVKKCGKCSQLLTPDKFYRSKNTRDGLHALCRICERKRQADYYSNPTNRQRKLKNNRELWRKRKPGAEMSYRRRKRYGVDDAFIDALLLSQNGHCPVCKRPLDATYQIDHDHKSKRVRGLLHFRCNVMLGNADDNPSVLAWAREYLLLGGS